jgi:hypothetical protein
MGTTTRSLARLLRTPEEFTYPSTMWGIQLGELTQLLASDRDSCTLHERNGAIIRLKSAHQDSAPETGMPESRQQAFIPANIQMLIEIPDGEGGCRDPCPSETVFRAMPRLRY